MAELTPETLLRAYAVGLFPMAERRDDQTLFWIDPEKRGILPIDRFHMPRSLARKLRRRPFEVRCDSAFEDVIRECAAPADDRPETWINEEIIALYTDLNEMGRAHSVDQGSAKDAHDCVYFGGARVEQVVLLFGVLAQVE